MYIFFKQFAFDAPSLSSFLLAVSLAERIERARERNGHRDQCTYSEECVQCAVHTIRQTIDALNMQCVSALFSVHCAHTIASCSYPLAFHSTEHTALHGRHKPYLTSYRAIELVTHRWPQFSWSDYYVRHLNATLKPVKRRIQYSVEYFANIN